jgi:putative transposase
MKDKIERKISKISKDLIMQSLFRGVSAKRPEPGLIHHSGRGSQFCSHEYGKILYQFGMKTSMSRKGNHSKKQEVKLW